MTASPISRATRAGAGSAELRIAGRGGLSLVWSVALFTAFVNLLMLTGPLFMLQVYERVLNSGSEPTLVALFGLVIFLFLMMGLLDHARGRVMARVGIRFQLALEARVFSAGLRLTGLWPGHDAWRSGPGDLDALRSFVAAPVVLALFDLPWTPLFLGAIFLFHPALGFLAVAGGAILVLVTALNQIVTGRAQAMAQVAAWRAKRMSDQLCDEAETALTMGMAEAGLARWQWARAEAIGRGLAVADRGNGFSTFSRTARLFLQSAMLALGAWLALQNSLTAGAMIAASILMGRALAPIEQVVGAWPQVQQAHLAWRRLAALLDGAPQPGPRTELPKPRAVLEARDLTVFPPGAEPNLAPAQPTLRMVSFRLQPGQALGVIGPSGAGKTTLARALIGQWQPAGGWVRLDGAALHQYGPAALGQAVGYLPQRVALFDGTIAENIARLARAPEAAAVVAAARLAGAHQMILDLPQGYDTDVSAAGGRLSGGQIQRIGLARALFGDPPILILDEANSNLDNDGTEALSTAVRAVKARGGAVLIMAHRPSAIAECDDLLVLDAGIRRAYGRRDEVLRATLSNAPSLLRSAVGGVA